MRSPKRLLELLQQGVLCFLMIGSFLLSSTAEAAVETREVVLEKNVTAPLLFDQPADALSVTLPKKGKVERLLPYRTRSVRGTFSGLN